LICKSFFFSISILLSPTTFLAVWFRLVLLFAILLLSMTSSGFDGSPNIPEEGGKKQTGRSLKTHFL
jgi:hypothetical protein